jgi:hypothetical protein
MGEMGAESGVLCAFCSSRTHAMGLFSVVRVANPSGLAKLQQECVSLASAAELVRMRILTRKDNFYVTENEWLVLEQISAAWVEGHWTAAVHMVLRVSGVITLWIEILVLAPYASEDQDDIHLGLGG